MEYRKKIILYSALIGILALTTVFGTLFSSQAVFQRQSSEPLLAAYTPEAVSSVTIEGQATLVRQEDSSWKVLVNNQPYPADNPRVKTFLGDLANLKKTKEVSNSKDLAAYGLDQPKRLQLRDKTGKVLYDLLVGKGDNLGKGVYVKMADKDTVWLTDRGFARSLELDFNTWCDLSLVPGSKKPADLARISWTGSLSVAQPPLPPKDEKSKPTPQPPKVYGPFQLDKQAKDQAVKWQLKSTGVFPANAEGYVTQVLGFKFTSYLKPDESFDPAQAVAVLTLEWGNGTKTEIKLGPSDDKKRIPAFDGQRKFWLADWALDSLAFKPQ